MDFASRARKRYSMSESNVSVALVFSVFLFQKGRGFYEITFRLVIQNMFVSKYYTVLQKKKFIRPKCDLYIVIDMDP